MTLILFTVSKDFFLKMVLVEVFLNDVRQPSCDMADETIETLMEKIDCTNRPTEYISSLSVPWKFTKIYEGESHDEIRIVK